MSGTAVRSREPRDRVTAEDLNVAPALLGQPLARPGRRAAAIAIDGLWIAAFNALGNAWVALALGGLLLWQRARRRATQPAALPAQAQPSGLPGGRPWRATLLALALLGLGALTQGDEGDASPRPGAGAREAARAPTAAATGDLAAWQARARHWRDELGEGWLWSLAYFTLLPAGWLGGRPGQTLGKRWLGLRVAELTGKPMTPLRNLKRYGGYAAGMATGGLGLAQLLWDGNRQAIQDKTAHTVVLDLRRAGTAGPAAAPPAGDGAPAG